MKLEPPRGQGLRGLPDREANPVVAARAAAAGQAQPVRRVGGVRARGERLDLSGPVQRDGG